MPNNQVGFARRRPGNNQVGLNRRNFNYGMAVARYGPQVAWKLSQFIARKAYDRYANGKAAPKRVKMEGVVEAKPRRLVARPMNARRHSHQTFLGRKKVTAIKTKYKLRRHQ